MATETENPDVSVLPTARIQTRPFAVALPSTVIQGFDEHEPSSQLDPVALFGDNIVVGSIVMMGNSVKIWIGWGRANFAITPGDNPTTSGAPSSFGSGSPMMGNLVVAMPRANFKGAFSSSSANDLPSSSLIGTGDSDDQILASQMASRLSQKSGKAVFVSCNLMTGGTSGWTAGMNKDLLAQRAAALAEKEIWSIMKS